MNYTRSLHNGSVDPNFALQGNILQWCSVVSTNCRKNFTGKINVLSRGKVEQIRLSIVRRVS